MSSRGLRKDYPWLTTKPTIVNAPMAEFAGPALATAVHKAGGFGFIGAIRDPAALGTALESACKTLLNKPLPDADEILPIGLGVLVFFQDSKKTDIIDLIGRFRPAAIWLFAAHTDAGYADWSGKVREASPKTKIWVQVSSVAAAVQAAKACAADVLVLQGSDAGGHGKTPGASVLSLLPEAADVLGEEGFGHVSLLAAGGMADGRSVAAALAAGADGIVAGTAFLAAEETMIHPKYQEAVLGSVDGGTSTVRATIFDELYGKNIWPLGYDGRAVVAQSYKDHLGGMTVEELRRLHQVAKLEEAQGFGSDNRRAAIWAGTGVGMVKRVRPATIIIEELRRDASTALQRAMARLQ